MDMDDKSLTLFHDMMDVILNESYCRFADKVFKMLRGFRPDAPVDELVLKIICTCLSETCGHALDII